MNGNVILHFEVRLLEFCLDLIGTTTNENSEGKMRIIIRFFFGLLSCVLFTPSPAAPVSPSLPNKLSGLQIPFIENKGQVDKDVAFYAPTLSGTVYVTKKGELVYALSGKADGDETTHTIQVLTERLLTGKPIPVPLTAASAKVSYFHGIDRASWYSDIATHNALSLGEVWPGIDVELFAHGRNVEKYFTVHPGASEKVIRVKLDGAIALQINAGGALEVMTESGMVLFTAPIAWQESEGKKQPVQVAYVLQDDTYGFKLGDYDATRPVIIDPLLQSTYLGGGSFDNSFSVAVHPITGDVYVTGQVLSSNFPGVAGGAQAVSGGATDTFIARLNSDLTTLRQSTYFGGTSYDVAYSLTIHPVTGDVFVAGYTSSNDLPGTVGGAQPVISGFSDAFITRLNADLTVLLQSTYLGGESYEYAKSVAIHPITGEVYVSGYTGSTDFPTTTGAAITTFGGSQDAFITRLNSGLTNVIQSTYLGGSSSDYGNALSIHPASGEIYVAGTTYSTDFPGVVGGAQVTNNAASDTFISRFNDSLTSLLQSTYLGGTGGDSAAALAIHPISGEIYVVGSTYSIDFPGTAGGVQESGGAAFIYDAFVARLNSGLTSLLQSTYLGGTGYDYAYAMAIHPVTGGIYMAGSTSSTDFPGLVGGAQASVGGSYDFFVSLLNIDLTGLLQTSYVGGTGNDYAYSLAISPVSNEVYVSGYSYSTNFPGTAGGAQETAAQIGGADSILVRITPSLALNDYTLTASKIGTGLGMVVSTDGLINCGTDCSEVYGNFLTTTLSAIPENGSVFSGWSGACINTTGECVVSMDASKDVTAIFNAGTYSLNVNKTGSGTGTVQSSDRLINCGLDCTENYAANTIVTLSARATSGSRFVGWSGACSGKAQTCTVAMDAAKTVSARFNAAILH